MLVFVFCLKIGLVCLCLFAIFFGIVVPLAHFWFVRCAGEVYGGSPESSRLETPWLCHLLGHQVCSEVQWQIRGICLKKWLKYTWRTGSNVKDMVVWWL